MIERVSECAVAVGQCTKQSLTRHYAVELNNMLLVTYTLPGADSSIDDGMRQAILRYLPIALTASIFVPASRKAWYFCDERREVDWEESCASAASWRP